MSEQFGKTLVGLGLAMALIGFLIIVSPKLPWLRLGHLPGDINIERSGFSLFVPFTTMLLASLLISLIFMIIGRYRR